MVYKCTSINCQFDYRGEKQDQKVLFHSYHLKDKHLLQTWLKRLARKDYVRIKHSKLCSLHFKFEDFVTDSTDQKGWRKRKRNVNFNKKATKVESFKDLIEKLPEELYRQRYIYILHRTENGADLICLSDHRPYKILSAVFINIDMEVTVCNNERIVPSSSYNHIMPTRKVTTVSQVSNLLAFAKNLDLKKPAAEEQFKANIFKLINSFLLKSANEQQISILKFFMKQINLAFSNKNSKKYSSDLLMLAYVIFAASPRAYERLVEEKILIFPSIKTLKRITLNLDSKTGVDAKQYLTLRFSQLNDFDRML